MPTSGRQPPPASARFCRHWVGSPWFCVLVAMKLRSCAELAGADHLDQGAVHGLVLLAVGDHQLDVGGVAGGDHALAVGGAGGHGLFAEDVLAGFGAADGELGVHGVGQDDVDDLDFGVLRRAGRRWCSRRWSVGLDAVLGGDLCGPCRGLR